MEPQLTPVFNRMSGADRLKLRFAAFMVAATAVIRDDTRAHPWKFPFYATYLTFLITPLPIPFAGMVLMGATLGWAKLGLTPWARWLNGRLRDAFNEKAMIDTFKPYIQPADAGRFRVDNISLAKDATKTAWCNSADAGRAAWQRLKSYLFP